MANVTLTVPATGSKRSTGEASVSTDFTTLETFLNKVFFEQRRQLLFSNNVGATGIENPNKYLLKPGGNLNGGAIFSNEVETATSGEVGFWASEAWHGAGAKYELRVVALADATAPTTGFKFYLCKVEKPIGAAGKLVLKLEAKLASTEAAIAAPAKETITVAKSTAATLAEGFYVVTCEPEGVQAANSNMGFRVQVSAVYA